MILRAHQRLRKGEVIEIEGLRLKIDGDGTVRPGDLYVAERNQGPRLLTAARIDERGWIVAAEPAYSYDVGECVRVQEVV